MIFARNRELTKLEERVARLEQVEECKNGDHIWTMANSAFIAKPPYIRCQYCYAVPKKEPTP